MIKIENTNKILTSKKGAAIVILGLILIPLICFCVAFAIDLNMYMGVKAYLNNALDAIATSALNKSSLDSYRADKILKIKDEGFFIDKVKSEVAANLVGSGGIIDQSGNTLNFNSNLDFLPHRIKLIVDIGTLQGAEYADGDNLSQAKEEQQSTKVTLTLETKVDLPFLGGVLKLFNIADLVPVNMKVSNTIRGIRVKKSNEF